MKILVSPSILNADFSRLEEECVSLEKCGADWIHCDVMDGKFVPNTSFGVSVVERVRKCVSLPLDVHLMVENPAACVKQFVEAGASFVTFHLEAARDVEASANLIKKFGAKVGISVKPATSVEDLLPYAHLADMILVMTVEPGFGGQKFIPQSIEKIRHARELFPDKLIQVDGGINEETASLAVHAGANVLVAGSAVIKSNDRKNTIEELKKV